MTLIRKVRKIKSVITGKGKETKTGDKTVKELLKEEGINV